MTGRPASEAIVGRVRERLARPPAGAGPGLSEHVQQVAGQVLGVADLAATVDGVRRAAFGLGPLQQLVDDPEVTDVLVNGSDGVWVDRGAGLRRCTVEMGGEPAVRALAVRLAAVAGRRLDEGCPWVDARLPDGVRLHAVVPPVAPGGTHVSLRVLRDRVPDLAGLEASGCLPPGWAPVLTELVRRRAAFLVTGGTGAGKTTLLAGLLSLVPAQERIVLVEDVAELRPRHPHVVRLEARHANVEGRGAVSLEDLVRQALRMRPDRLVVGECRGPEVRELLAALNTGHAGGCGTVHANTARDVPARLEALGASAGLAPAAVALQAAAALDVVVHLRREGALRRVVEIAVIAGVERPGGGRGLEVLTALQAADDVRTPGRTGPGWERLAQRLSLSTPPR